MSRPTILFGLSANPIHLGHVQLADAAHHLLNAARTYLMVTPGHHLKDPAEYSPFPHRLAMAERAVADYPHLHVTDFEAHVTLKDENTRTWEVLQAWQSQNPTTPVIWMMGADNWEIFHSWGGHKEILTNFPVIVAARPGNVANPLETAVGKAFADYQTTLENFSATRANWLWLPIDTHPASATRIRQQLQKKEPPEHLAPTVYQYIQENGLYR